jgi:hypothetical protein
MHVCVCVCVCDACRWEMFCKVNALVFFFVFLVYLLRNSSLPLSFEKIRLLSALVYLLRHAFHFFLIYFLP